MKKIILIDKSEFFYFNAFLESLLAILNQKKQEKAWLLGDYSEYTNFTEIYMGFSDIAEYIIQWSVLSKSQKKLLEDFYDVLDKYDDFVLNNDVTERDIYLDAKWNEIRAFAKRVYDALKNVEYKSE